MFDAKAMARVPQKFLDLSVTIEGETRTVLDWCTLKDIRPVTAYQRRQRAYSWIETFRPVDGGSMFRKTMHHYYQTKG